MNEAHDPPAATRTEEAAERVVLTYHGAAVPEDLRFWVHDELTRETFRGSFRNRHDRASVGETFGEFVSRGCGVPVDVTLRVAAVEGGPVLTDGTEVVVRRS